jgi:hypothetical protein
MRLSLFAQASPERSTLGTTAAGGTAVQTLAIFAR